MLQGFCLSLIILSVYSILCHSSQLDYHSFQPPFDEVDVSGFRIPNMHWRTGGTTVVNSNFVRLTPDRQSKIGSLWSRRALGVPSFSAILKFRISGQGKNFFGDGIGMWIVQQGYYGRGDVHGFQESFIGIGIIFDTFKNTENLSAHRDVTLLINDGEKTYEMMTTDVKGCNANFRYHNERADFSVTDASRAKIVINDTSLSIMIDAKNIDVWEECVTVNDIGLPHQWLLESHIGFTATTGQLADNHDLISFKSFSDNAVMESEESKDRHKKLFSLNMTAEHKPEDLISDVKVIENAINDVMVKLEVLDHHVEHQMAAVADHVKNLLVKLEKKEENAESRIEELENLVKK
eukprot:gene11075-14869_t